MYARLLLLALVFGLTCPPTLAQEEAPAPKKAPAPKAETEAAKPAAKEKEAPAAATGLSIKAKSQKKNQIRRLLQNSKLPQAWDAAWAAYNNYNHPDDRDLRAYAAWALSVMKGLLGQVGLEGAKDPVDYGCLDWFDRAIEEGWSNPFTFEYASLIPVEIRQSPEFLERVNKLKREFRQEQARQVEAALQESFSRKDTPRVRLPESLSETGGYDPSALTGRPVVLVVTRIHHEGMTEVVDVLNDVGEESESLIPVRTLFYQYFADDTESIEQTPHYAEHLGLEIPYGVVDRSFMLDNKLEIPFFPTLLFLDGEGKILYQHEGLIDREFFETVLKAVQKSTGVKEQHTEGPAPEKTEPDVRPSTPDKNLDQPVQKSSPVIEKPTPPPAPQEVKEATEKLEDAQEKIDGALEALENRSTLEKKGSEAGEAVKEKAKESGEKLEKAGEAAEQLKNEASEALKEVPEKATEKAESAEKKATEKAGEAVKEVQEEVGEAAEEIQEKAGSAEKQATEKAGEAVKEIQEEAGEAAEEVQESLKKDG